MALDTTGIWLSEVKSRFPPIFQTLNYDVALDTDSMSKPRILSSYELGINAILTLLLMKPGQYPSIPELGIDIESYLFEYADDKSIPITIKTKLIDQCNYLDIIGIDIDVSITTIEGNVPALVIKLSPNEQLGYGNDYTDIIIGISYDQLKGLYIKRISL